MKHATFNTVEEVLIFMIGKHLSVIGFLPFVYSVPTVVWGFIPSAKVVTRFTLIYREI